MEIGEALSQIVGSNARQRVTVPCIMTVVDDEGMLPRDKGHRVWFNYRYFLQLV